MQKKTKGSNNFCIDHNVLLIKLNFLKTSPCGYCFQCLQFNEIIKKCVGVERKYVFRYLVSHCGIA
jgi:hypothetical protein